MKLEQIWHQYEVSLRAFLFKNLRNQADVDDILQDVMLKTYQNIGTLNDVGKLKSWLFQIAHNAMMDFYRKQKPSEEFSEQLHELEASETLLIVEMGPCIEPFINRLATEQQGLLKAIELEGMSQKQYAEQHNINYSTVKSRVQRARDDLYQLFNRCCLFTRDAQGNLIDYTKRDDCNCPDPQ
jgi:RNA polymerase sigma-70 factor (ECF subfamily)